MGILEERAGLAGRVAVVPGGAGGLGEAISLDLAACGVRVAALDRNAESVERLRAAFAERGGDALVQTGDARDPDALAALFAAADDRWGRLDVLVNVVGGTFRAPFTETSPKAWDALLRTNLVWVLHACLLAIPRMRAGGRGGSIVNLTTIEAHRAAPGFAVYAAAKSGLAAFARTLAVELAPERIRVNNVAPDITPTPGMTAMDPSLVEGDDGPGARVAVPMGRLGTRTDVANAVLFLASELSAYITGTTLHPDGGALASSGWLHWPEDGFRNTVPARFLERG